MTERNDGSPDRAVDLSTIQADDALLDALAGGARPAGDPLADLLADWRDDLSADLPPLRADVAVTAAGADDVPTLRGDVPIAPSVPDISRMSGDGGRRRGARPGRGLRRAFAGTIAAAVLLAGAAVGARQSGPDGPLWPLTQVLYPEQAHERAAQQAIAEAEAAIANGDAEGARRRLDAAAREAAQVDDPGARQRLLDRIDDLRRSLPTAATPAPAPSTAAPATTAPATQAPAPTATPAPGGTTPANPGGGGNNPTGGSDPLIPGLPTQIVPSVPGLPLPTPNLTTLLPKI
jgi:hypothetical protein